MRPAAGQQGAAAGIPARQAATQDAEQVLARLGSTRAGLSGAEAGRRLAPGGPNAVRTHRVRALAVFGRQLRSALLFLLLAAAVGSFFFGERTDAVIIGVILLLSVALGFANEYRAERAAQALHSQVRRTAVVLRDGHEQEVDVTGLVPGDVVRLALGQIVPADLRVLERTGLQCDESILTGESAPVDKDLAAVDGEPEPAELSCCALMGTVVHAGSGTGVVVATGGRAEFGRIALGLGERQPETAFQVGLRRFSVLLLQVAAALTTGIFVINTVLHRPLLDAPLFPLAIAAGITPLRELPPVENGLAPEFDPADRGALTPVRHNGAHDW
ncbi:cation-transporting P-type ATPase [Kitasatospora sp. NPDC048407]|uniref:P-type ATPase n=1 Tax=Kitasatospora sp. NPDC048407 TaxID=3364051 RepID=UPI003710BD7A